MVRTKVTVLANAVRVVRSVDVRTPIRWLFSPSCVVAVFAHTFSVKLKVSMRARRDELSVFSFFVFLLRLFQLSRTPLAASLNLCTQAASWL